jgi:hypothetical protein
MASGERALQRLGGISLIASGVLFLLISALERVTGPPPSSGAAILAWVAAGSGALAWSVELLFFAAMFLVPGVIALHRSLAGGSPALAAAGCGAIAALIPVLLVLDIVQGRLVFPVHGLRLASPEVVELTVALHAGGMHAVLVVMGLATALLSVAMWRGAHGKGLAALGLVTSVLDLVGSYPWAIGPLVLLVSQALFAGWFVAVGWSLSRMRE